MHQRNFRSAYLETLGIRGVQVKVSIENVLKDEVVDMVKLAKLNTNFGVPAMYRIIVWKLLLGILPKYQDEWVAVQAQRREQYEYVRRSIDIISGQLHDDHGYESLGPETVVKMCLLTFKMHASYILHSENNKALEHMHAVARMFVDICEDDADAYWLTLRFLAANQLAVILAEPVKTTGVRIYRHVAVLSKLAWIEDAGLCTHLNRLDLSLDQIAFRWFRSRFAEDFPLSSIERIWDRLIGGQNAMCICIGLGILLTFRNILIPLRTKDAILAFFAKLPDGYIDRILDSAVQMYERHGGMDLAEV